MIRHQVSFLNFHLQLPCEAVKYGPQFPPNLPIKDFSATFRDKDDVVFTIPFTVATTLVLHWGYSLSCILSGSRAEQSQWFPEMSNYGCLPGRAGGLSFLIIVSLVAAPVVNAGKLAFLGGRSIITALRPQSLAGPTVTRQLAKTPTAAMQNHFLRGTGAEARVAKDLGLTKNTTAVFSREGKSIPDVLTSTMSIEIKDTKMVYLTRQLRIQSDAAQAAGLTPRLITGTHTYVAPSVSSVFKISRRPDLGPQF